MADGKCWNSDNVIIIDAYAEETGHPSKEKMVPYREFSEKLAFPNDMLKYGIS